MKPFPFWKPPNKLKYTITCSSKTRSRINWRCSRHMPPRYSVSAVPADIWLVTCLSAVSPCHWQVSQRTAVQLASLCLHTVFMAAVNTELLSSNLETRGEYHPVTFKDFSFPFSNIQTLSRGWESPAEHTGVFSLFLLQFRVLQPHWPACASSYIAALFHTVPSLWSALDSVLILVRSNFTSMRSLLYIGSQRNVFFSQNY